MLAQALGPEVEFGASVGQLVLDPSALELDGVASFADLGSVEHAVGGEVDEPLFLGVEPLELPSQLGVQFTRQGLLLGEHLVDHGADGAGETGIQIQGTVDAADGLFDLPGGEMRQVAAAGFAAHAFEVAVVAAVASFGFGVDETGLPTSLVTAFAEQHPLEKVVQHPVPAATGGAGFNHFLHTVEQGLADDRGVASRHQLPVNRDPPGVVGVGQHGMELRRADRLLTGRTGRRTSRQAEVGHGRFQPFEGVVAGGVEFECLQDERCALLVEPDRVVQPSVLLGADVEVAQLGAGDGPAVKRLVTQLLSDVLAVLTHLEFVEDVGHGLHGIRHVAGPEVLFAGDDAHTHEAQRLLGDGGVKRVAEGARAGVDNQVADLGVRFQVLQ